VFSRLSPRFEAMYSEIGRPSIPPERLLGARLLMALFSVPSERAFCERLRYDLLFQWFLDLELEEEPFDASTFSKNQQRLLEHQVADEFLAEVVDVLRQRNLLSEEHFCRRRHLDRRLGFLEEFPAQGRKGSRTEGQQWVGRFFGPEAQQRHP
jgi:transposase